MEDKALVPFRVSLKAARINKCLSQKEVAISLNKYFGQKVSRQRISYYEKKPDRVPPAYGEAFSKLYKIPMDYILFIYWSTLSYLKYSKKCNFNESL